ncbi:hypothetical protein [Mycobacteroides saopaulense]|uniref:Uncharacterized protein n=1 Tax=Mycobacteroides saopaulense TaxID=1578165 RepID=A0ABX3BYF0_9MYCO|nr:hypothetical protein [Mycobacteroides saopaulense]OHT86916.1 hypothetical protein BKG68_12590 [Mycobacteroides saopaulense]OHU08771.1 hypothetical protein BKG73_17280 [Mycobacteroides saopaulense]
MSTQEFNQALEERLACMTTDDLHRIAGELCELYPDHLIVRNRVGNVNVMNRDGTHVAYVDLTEPGWQSYHWDMDEQ